MDKEVLEVALKRFTRESKIEKVLEVEVTQALPKGENYTSTILRLRLKVILGNGRTTRRSLIIKQIITKDEMGKWNKEHSVARAEVEIYLVIHKEMTYLMQEFEDTDDTLWCNFILYDPDSSSLVMEDLKSSGYRLVPRQEGLNLDHACLALRGLGRYHGMAKVLEERSIINKDNYRPYFILSNEDVIKQMFYGGLQNITNRIAESWGPDWEPAAKKLLVPFEKVAQKLLELRKPLSSEFTVLNHGDCWSNNMMFKYDWQGQPISVKFLDYQLPHYNTPCVDVTNFMYFSIQPPVRRANFNLLLQTYHDSLVKTLDKFGYRESKPTLADIMATMDRLSFFGRIMFVSCYALLVCKSTEAIDVDKLLETNGSSGINPEILKEPGMEEKIKPDLVDFINDMEALNSI